MTTETKIDAEDWISQETETTEGTTVSKFLEENPDSSREEAKQLFRKFEKDGLIFRQGHFISKDRVYADVPGIPAVVTEESELFHDVFDVILELTKGPKGGFRYKRLIAEIRERHPERSNIDILKLLHKLVKLGFLGGNKKPFRNMFTIVGYHSSTDTESFDEFITDHSDFEKLPSTTTKEFVDFIDTPSHKERLLGSKDFGEEIGGEEISVEKVEKKETPVAEVKPTPTITEEEKLFWGIEKPKAVTKPPIKPPALVSKKTPLSWLSGVRMGKLISMAGKAISDLGEQIQEWNVEDELGLE